MTRISSVLGAAVAVAAIVPAGAHAAAIERAVPSAVRVLYEEGRYIEFGVTYTDPDQRGDNAFVPPNFTGGAPLTFTGNTGDLFDDHWNFSAAYKADLTEKLSYAILFDQPYGADVSYGQGTFPGGLPYAGSGADLNTYQITGVLAYDVNPNVKVYGGLRAQRLDAEATLAFVGPTFGLPGYTVDADSDWGYGYLVGAAYARPEIALRVALTYFSKIEHNLDTTEFGGIPIPPLGFPGGDTRTNVDTPQSVTLEAQSGVAPGTLVFGSVRWVDWSDFTIAPPIYTTILQGRPLVDYQDDWWTYTLGVARSFTDQLAGSLSVSYEPDVGGEMTTLGPYDGRTTGTAALSYDFGQYNITGGLTYGKLGDTRNVLNTDFNDGSVWGAGLRVSYSF